MANRPVYLELMRTCLWLL